jgi:hypothetical protein
MIRLKVNAAKKHCSSLNISLGCNTSAPDNNGRKFIFFTEHADYAVLAHTGTGTGTSEPMLLGRPVCTVNKFSFLTMLDRKNIATLNF